MPRGKKLPVSDGLDRQVSSFAASFGERLARVVAEGIADAVSGSDAPTGERKSAMQACVVPACGRPGAARSLCSVHYSKARRLGFTEAILNKEQLNTLARDGRKPRFSGQAR